MSGQRSEEAVVETAVDTLPNVQIAAKKFTDEARAKGFDVVPAKRRGNHATDIYDIGESYLQRLSTAARHPDMSTWTNICIGGAIGALPGGGQHLYDLAYTESNWVLGNFVSLLVFSACVGGILIGFFGRPKKAPESVDDICQEIRDLPEK